ncbi:MAG: 1-acyl-sn-glycerol-3-phosphate acyltransferase [Planctomycetes bacterium]|nr:1-acyl-sn-glycerol-3-phosphate acyltransferase [Planctomycetota bacterium]
MLRIFFIVVFKLRVYGRERVPASGGVVIASNHQSFFDPVLVGVGLPRSLNYMARDSLFRFLPFRWLIRSLNAFPLRREGIDTATIREAIRRVSNGGVLVIFPEGTRTRDGRISAIKKGVGLISRHAKAPIVPAVIDGAFEAWPRHKVLCRPFPIKVAFGPPISYAQQAAMSEEEMAQIITDRMAALQRFLFEKRDRKREAARR